MTLRAGPEDRGLRLDVFLARHLQDLTRSHIQSLNRTGAVRIEGRLEKAGYKLRGGEAIEVDLAARSAAALEPRDIPLTVVYEDEDLAVIDKPAGLAVHPGAATKDTVVHALLFKFRTLSQSGGEGRPGIVHRIDKWTSGLLIVAKNDWAHARLSKAFQNRTIEKTYLALVHGKLQQGSGEISLSIGRHTTIRTRMAARPGRGRPALSTYRRLEEIGNFSLLEVRIKTGRTHQIRVHFSAIGHPVVGDEVYGERAFAQFTKKYEKPGRYFLHASGLKFAHPRTGQILEFHSPWPPELQALLDRLRQ